MTKRERFRRAMKFQAVDRLPLLSQGAWETTANRWRAEGMRDLADEFRLYDAPMQNCWLYGPCQEPIPPFEAAVLREDAEYVDARNAKGQVERRYKGATSMPAFLEYPVQSRADWREYRKRLDPGAVGRYPSNWAELVRERNTPGAAAADDIRGVTVWGYYGFPRELMGPEHLSAMFYDDPSLVEEMNAYWLDFTMKRLAKGLKEMTFDYALIWEDNCYNHGMLHSPSAFKTFMAPHYRKLIEFFRQRGIDIISVDSDGNVLDFIPLLLDVGVTGLHPFEVAAGMDVVPIGRKYPEMQIWGGLDKRALAQDRRAIDAELERVLPAMKQRGGYGAGLDHGIPSDVPLENHRYFVQRLSEMSRI